MVCPAVLTAGLLLEVPDDQTQSLLFPSHKLWTQPSSFFFLTVLLRIKVLPPHYWPGHCWSSSRIWVRPRHRLCFMFHVSRHWSTEVESPGIRVVTSETSNNYRVFQNRRNPLIWWFILHQVIFHLSVKMQSYHFRKVKPDDKSRNWLTLSYRAYERPSSWERLRRDFFGLLPTESLTASSFSATSDRNADTDTVTRISIPIRGRS